ncbi:MAG: ribosome maturation factor RimP [Candidatus Latescibacterota bacterium]|nr:MAG: ribosome maturation factor RimP [Candidatus Latescibacterota bacterium]
MEKKELEKVIAPELAALGFECVKLELLGSPKNPIVRLYIDRPGGVSIKHCASVSRAIGLVLDEMDPFPGRYLLEVSSPGNNRPLTKEEHYVRFVGREARVQCLDAERGKKTYTGHIRSCINGLLVLDTDEGERSIRLSDISKANLFGQEYKIDKKQKKTRRNKDGRK